MISKIYDFLSNKGKVGEHLQTALVAIVLVERLVLMVAAGLITGGLIGRIVTGGKYTFEGAVLGLILFGYEFYDPAKWWPFKFFSIEGVIDAFVDEPLEKRQEKAVKFGKLPHFEEKLQEKKVMGVISRLAFSPYVTRDGEILSHITVSEDEKWLCIMNGYMPLDFICGYNDSENILYSIDGAEIRLPARAKSDKFRREIKRFFKDRGIYYTSMPWMASAKFDSSFERPYTELDKADFSRIRYNWEKANAEEKFGYSQNVRVFDDYKPVDDNGNLATTIFERVLSDTEIARTAKAIRKKKVSLSYYLNFEDYRNEYSVCNGIELLEKITYPKNAEGIDFLFRCMWDVDEAYFTPAVELLMSYPKDMVRRKIEEEIKIAFENEDVVRIGGLMFLADKLKYEIRFLEEIRENQNVNEEMHQLLTFPQI